MKIVALDTATFGYPKERWEAFAEFGELGLFARTAYDTASIVKNAAGAQVLLTNKVPLRAEALRQLPDLKFIAVTATGYNIVDTAAARELGIAVANVPTYGTATVAQHTAALLLELGNNAGLHDRSVHDGDWVRCPDFCYWQKPVIELSGKVLGIVGLGRIGRAVAKIGDALGMTVWASARTRRDTPAFEGFAWKTTEEIFRGADFVSLHCPQTPENLQFVNAALLRQMKPTAMLVNTSRGALVNEADLAAALNAGIIAGAAVDVVSQEPMRADNPLLTAKNCVITPHMAWTGEKARATLLDTSRDNVRAFLAGKPQNVVN